MKKVQVTNLQAQGVKLSNANNEIPVGGWRGADEIPAGGWRGADEIPAGGWRGADEIPAGGWRGADAALIGMEDTGLTPMAEEVPTKTRAAAKDDLRPSSPLAGAFAGTAHLRSPLPEELLGEFPLQEK